MNRRPIVHCAGLALAFTVASAAWAQGDRVHRFQDRQGVEVELHSGQPLYRSDGPAPAFAMLDADRDGRISADEARAYPLLATDFLYADGNRDGRLSEREYARWTAQR
ncbi:MAG TPA: EF-hand domain-containing protein [Dokdonella sp.]|uniref:EF-hand domain-containing protein n=1 Tax=Dokdonella sp. TaxID=2291710 RepID=UPI002D197F48|nr:EF-hand domain-containing protein [Dokdonella sp.]HUD41392.1 EF-hand domain-containing protein [Dokdonella sp.]